MNNNVGWLICIALLYAPMFYHIHRKLDRLGEKIERLEEEVDRMKKGTA